MLFAVIFAIACSQALARSRIVDGTEATPGQFPHQCALKFFGNHNCGCSILSENWVVTAAHCLGSAESLYRVVTGQHDRSPGEEGNRVEHSVESYVSHPDYGVGAGAFPNDIGVIRLNTVIDFDDFAQPIQLAEGDEDYAGQNCTISGWGRIYGNGPLANILQYANVGVLSNPECESFWGNNVNDGHVCILDTGDQSSLSCNGDSGGPLQCDDILVGVTSWGASGCVTTYPAGYTRVSEFRDWIRDTTGI